MDGVDSEDLGGDAMTQNDIYKIQRMYGCGKFWNLFDPIGLYPYYNISKGIVSVFGPPVKRWIIVKYINL